MLYCGPKPPNTPLQSSSGSFSRRFQDWTQYGRMRPRIDQLQHDIGNLAATAANAAPPRRS